MSIETYYFSTNTSSANATELYNYLNRYASDLNYTVTKTTVQTEDDEPLILGTGIAIYNNTNGSPDPFPMISLKLGNDAALDSTSPTDTASLRWIAYAHNIRSDNYISNTEIIKPGDIKLIYAKIAYKTSNGIMVLFSVKNKPITTIGVTLAKNSVGRLSLASTFLIGKPSQSNVPIVASRIVPLFVSDSTNGTFTSLWTKETPDANPNIGSTPSTTVIYSYSLYAGKTVLAPVVGTDGIYSPYIFWRVFTETPGSIGIIDINGVKYATDGLFALKE